MTKKIQTSTKIVTLQPFDVGIILWKFWKSWKFCWNAQFLQSFRQSIQNCGELCFFIKSHTRKLGEITVFMLCNSGPKFWLCHVNNITLISSERDYSLICKLKLNNGYYYWLKSSPKSMEFLKADFVQCTVMWHNNNASQ